jgi:hypothetical protein
VCSRIGASCRTAACWGALPGDLVASETNAEHQPWETVAPITTTRPAPRFDMWKPVNLDEARRRRPPRRRRTLSEDVGEEDKRRAGRARERQRMAAIGQILDPSPTLNQFRAIKHLNPKSSPRDPVSLDEVMTFVQELDPIVTAAFCIDDSLSTKKDRTWFWRTLMLGRALEGMEEMAWWSCHGHCIRKAAEEKGQRAPAGDDGSLMFLRAYLAFFEQRAKHASFCLDQLLGEHPFTPLQAFEYNLYHAIHSAARQGAEELSRFSKLPRSTFERLRFCAYSKCSEPYFIDPSSGGHAKYCSQRHRTAGNRDEAKFRKDYERLRRNA